MGLNVVEKILQSHLVSGTLDGEGEIGLRIDHTLTQDATGTMAYLEFEAMGFDQVKNELAVSYVDHNTIQTGPENADDHRYLQSVAAKYGIVYSKPGNGICHQLHLERFAVPGKTLLGSDSHTPTAGGVAMLAMGAGGIDVAAAMGGSPYYIASPQVTRIELSGRMKPWVSAKDIVLRVLEVLSTTGNAGTILEYGGKALATLDVPDRATITNMGAECGVITSVFPSDELTKKFLAAQERVDLWKEIVADPDAEYANTIEIDLSELEPLAATPHSPGNISSVATLAGTKVDQVLIGSCTNSSYRDLKTVCKILDGNHVDPSVTLGIAPGSRQVLLMLEKEKLLSSLISAGARLLENACGFCIGNSMSPTSDAVSLRTSNRNFEGRSGTQSANIYLVSPEIAAIAAIHGRIMDPSLMDDMPYNRVKMPSKFIIDDSMFVHPPAKGDDIKIVRGPHMGAVPNNKPLEKDLKGVVAIKVEDKITTDHIMPAGRRLKYRSNVEAYSEFVFENTDASFAKRAAANRDKGLHNVIVAGVSYGQGSSREHAALCPMYLGVKAVVAKSIERIHVANLINFGIVPLLFVKAEGYSQLDPDDEISLIGLRDAIAGDGKAILQNVTKNVEIALKTDLSERQKSILLAGGLLNQIGSAAK